MSNGVIDLSVVSPEVIQIKMQDRVNKNTFSAELIAGLLDAFETIKASKEYKVVILTGYDSYFSSGAGQDTLLQLSNGHGKFTDTNLYSLALDCQIPVISAMQGHGIGGGFVMGLFADFVILSKESIYTTNFMKYGFTPGMGATFILPQKLGISLAQEMLMAAKTYRGEELQKRAIPFPVMPREQVGAYALELAQTLAKKPRTSLITLKNHLVQSLREQLPLKIKQEIDMHEVTFQQKEVKENIQELFNK